jgi:pSer/pThr/pTyr-binding forkhead associated (FHA) protein
LISRHHCQLDLDGPHVRIRDLNSRNGTYLNGWLVKSPELDQAIEVVPQEHEVKDGDELRVGPISFRVTIR